MMNDTLSVWIDADTSPRVSDAGDYAEGFMIEVFRDWNGWTGWAVPAWEEQGFPELVGPFLTWEAAQAALDSFNA